MAARTMGNKQTIFTEEQLDNYQVSPRPSLVFPSLPGPQKPAPRVTLGLYPHSKLDLGPRLLRAFTWAARRTPLIPGSGPGERTSVSRTQLESYLGWEWGTSSPK